MSALITYGIMALVIVIAILFIGFTIARLYKRSSKELSYVRTGMGGEKVIMNGGAIVLPVVHEVIPVNMNTLRLEVSRTNEQSLITKDRMRVDIQAEFYVRVKPTAESISAAAQTLGQKTLNISELKSLVEGKFVDALRSVSAEMGMEELHEKRADFVQKVQQTVSEDLTKNGLELEAVSLTSFDQTDVRYFNPQNLFDSEGLKALTKNIESNRKERNAIEQETDLSIKQKNLETEQQRLKITREEEYAKMEQERELAIRKSEQQAEIMARDSEKQRESEEARIAAQREVELKEIASQRDIEKEQILRDQQIQTAKVERQKTIEIAEQERAIAIAQKSQAESEAKAKADEARATAVKAEEEVTTVRLLQQAERQKSIELVAAKQVAEKQAVQLTIAAEAEKKAAIDKAEAVKTEAEAKAKTITIAAKAEADRQSIAITTVADAEKAAAQSKADALLLDAKAKAESQILLAEAAEKQYTVDAVGKRELNEADNLLSADQIAMKIKLELIKALPDIIAQSVKPMENIEGIKILQVNGLTGQSSGEAGSSQEATNLADQMTNSALRYRAQAPLVDSLMNELGIKGGDINGFTQSVVDQK